jgi:ABC-2 type transport system ATP-binding protein
MSKSNDEVAVKVSGVSKSFKLPHEKNISIKSFVTNPFRRRSFEKQEVLKDINFEIKKGEFFGIVGRNGSGKSTLLKLLAGIYSPDKGHVQINGSLTPFIELGVGFNPDLTGRENVYLNGALLGFNRKEMSAMYEEIIVFAELEKFMDQKLRNYSSGMQVRLAFSIAIRAKNEILILDEVLAVGDAAFQKKCIDFFEKQKANHQTIVLVTHDMNVVQKYCNRAILIENGVLKAVDDPDIIAEKYLKSNFQKQTHVVHEDKSNDINIKYKDNYVLGENMTVNISWEKTGIKNVGIALYKSTGERIFATNTLFDKVKVSGNSITYNLKLDVAPGEYFFRVRTYTDVNSSISTGIIERTPFFAVDADEENVIDGLVPLEYNWEK